MNLHAEDLPRSAHKAFCNYPLEMIQALALVWCFAALRSDEIQRLRVGCIRFQTEDVRIPETGETLEHENVCFLEVPVNKTTMGYTKPVHTLVGQSIKRWEEVRPSEQLKALDHKTGEMVQFLFFFRGRSINHEYLNATLIPLLCKKAGVPLQDSRGKITSHRARATIASLLYNSKETLDALQIKEYLGHKFLTSTQSYLKVDPTQLASKVGKAGYLEQNLATVEVLLNQEAILSGAAAGGEMWKYYDLGHGYCTNPFWVSCAHRMVCAKCSYYAPKEEIQKLSEEGKVNLTRMLEFVSLTEDEKLLVTEGIELHQGIAERLAHLPIPVPQEQKMVSVTSIRRRTNSKA